MELLQAINRTVYANGKTVVYKHGMMPKKRTTKGINYWYSMLALMRRVYGWKEEHIEP